MKSRTQISHSQGKGLEITFLIFYAECFFMQQDFNQKRKHLDKQTCSLDCLQSAFSLKIRLVLISSGAIANQSTPSPMLRLAFICKWVILFNIGKGLT